LTTVAAERLVLERVSPRAARSPRLRFFMKKSLLLAIAALAAFPACVPRAWVHPYKNPLTAEEHLTLARLYHEDGKRDAALSEAKAAVQRAPGDTTALFYLGDLYVEAARWNDAKSVYRRILKREPGNGRALNNLAMVYLQSGKNQGEARSLAERALAADPDLEPYVLDTLLQITLAECDVEAARGYLDRFKPVAAREGGPFPARADDAEAQLAGCAAKNAAR
jgi:tetratricopeptide (TPR) repeat protein